MIRPGDESQKDILPAPVYRRIWIGGSLVLFVLILLILWLGVFLQGVWDLIAALKIAWPPPASLPPIRPSPRPRVSARNPSAQLCRSQRASAHLSATLGNH